jgi:serine/threonine protein kinase
MPNDSEQYLFTLQNGNLKVLEKVGQGGMGVVYRGVDNLMRSVAIKEFSPSPADNLSGDLLSELKDAFYREARLLANLSHPSLPNVYGYFAEAAKLYLVMEFIEGDDLKKQVDELKKKFDGQFLVKKVRQWAKELLEVLNYLHDRDSPIFHRDIKPENLKIRDGKICLLDFGLAKGTAGNMSVSARRTIYGFTLKYAPIEQMNGERTTAKMDLYALAATLYFLLTGEEPVDARTRARALAEHSPDPLTDVRELRPEVDGDLATVVMQALAVEAGRRPDSARAMLKMLEARPASSDIEADEETVHPPRSRSPLPPAAPQYSPTPTPSHPSPGSHRTLVGVVAGVVGVCLLGLIVLVFFWPRTPPPANNNQPTAGAKALKLERTLYKFPRATAAAVATLSVGTKLRVVQTWDKNWFQIDVQNGYQGGWVYCAEGVEECFNSE